MPNIRVDVRYTIQDGAEIKFRSPVDCSQVTGLKVYYPGADGNTTSKEFAFADAHGNNVGDIDHLFAENVVVKVILDVTNGMAFVQNADTNAYLEGHIQSKNNPHGVTAEQIGAATTQFVEDCLIDYVTTSEFEGGLNTKAPAGFVSEHITINTTNGLVADTELKSVYAAMPEASIKFIRLIVNNPANGSGLIGGSWFITIYKGTNDYGVLEAYLYGKPTYAKRRSIYGGTWCDWEGICSADFAPVGYGLGKNIDEMPTANDANDCIKNGWYKLIIATANGIGAQGIMRVDAENSESIVQTAHSGYSTGKGMVIMQRIKFKGTWGEWEWVTPLCVSGVEYRTTQRFLGKPVYTRCYDCGATGNTDYTITTDINRYGAIVFQVAGDDESFALPVYSGNGGARNKWIEINADNNQKIIIVIHSINTDYANRKTRVQIWYTK